MCKNNPKIGDLPLVLQDLVLQFAYNMPREQVLDSLEVILDIKSMQLPHDYRNFQRPNTPL